MRGRLSSAQPRDEQRSQRCRGRLKTVSPPDTRFWPPRRIKISCRNFKNCSKHLSRLTDKLNLSSKLFGRISKWKRPMLVPWCFCFKAVCQNLKQNMNDTGSPGSPRIAARDTELFTFLTPKQATR